ncbi:kinesin-like protein KIF26B [Lampetra fluviatilis]
MFRRAAQKLNLASRRKKRALAPTMRLPHEPPVFPTNFSGLLRVSPPPAPPCLLRGLSKTKESPGIGKVKVMLRICPSHSWTDRDLDASSSTSSSPSSSSFLRVDGNKGQIILQDPSPPNGLLSPLARRTGVLAPKMFAFDGVFCQDASQAEVCAGTVADVVQSVVNGADGCVFCFGHAQLGKSYTMLGWDDGPQSLGVMPCAVSWLYRLIEERRERAGARFSVRVSAVELWGKDEQLQDLLADVATGRGADADSQSPGIYLREDPIFGTQLQNQNELRAPTPEMAAYYLDAALAARRSGRPDCEEEERRSAHMLFTLHVYQYRMDKTGKGGMTGGRSRLHLIDLGSCERLVPSRGASQSPALSLSSLGNVILALVNGAKHIPYRDSKLTMLLRESLGNINCRTTMIIHVSPLAAHYPETLSTVQLAARIHRMRKKKPKYASSSSGGDSSCEEGRARRSPLARPLHPRLVALDPDIPCGGGGSSPRSCRREQRSSEPDYSSSSEQSCDTVIYVGPDGGVLSDRELTDNEGPPDFVPIIPSLGREPARREPRSPAVGGPRYPDRDRLKCSTFAELQERLECIDGSEEPDEFFAETARREDNDDEEDDEEEEEETAPAAARVATTEEIAASSPRQGPESRRVPGKSALPKARGISSSLVTATVAAAAISPRGAALGCTAANIIAQSSRAAMLRDACKQQCQAAIAGGERAPRKPQVGSPQPRRAKPSANGKGSLPSPAPPPPCCSDVVSTGRVAQEGPAVELRAQGTRTPPVGMSLPTKAGGEAAGAGVRARTVTVQQPLELSDEDVLVFALVEELTFGGVLGLQDARGRPASIISFASNCSVQALASGSRPVSIISSIIDDSDYDPFPAVSPVSPVAARAGAVTAVAQDASAVSRCSSVSSWLSEVSAESLGSEGDQSCDSFVMQSCGSLGKESVDALSLDSRDLIPDGLGGGGGSSSVGGQSTLHDSGFSTSEGESKSCSSSYKLSSTAKASKSAGKLPPVPPCKPASDGKRTAGLKSGLPQAVRTVGHAPSKPEAERTDAAQGGHKPPSPPAAAGQQPKSTAPAAAAPKQGGGSGRFDDPWKKRDEGIGCGQASGRAGKSCSGQSKQQSKPSKAKLLTGGAGSSASKSTSSPLGGGKACDGGIATSPPESLTAAGATARWAGSAEKAGAPALLPTRGAETHGFAVTGARTMASNARGGCGAYETRPSGPEKAASLPKQSMLPRLKGAPPAPPVRKSSLDQKNRAGLPVSALSEPALSSKALAKRPAQSDAEARVVVGEYGGGGRSQQQGRGVETGQSQASYGAYPHRTNVSLHSSILSLHRADSLTSLSSRGSLGREGSGRSGGKSSAKAMMMMMMGAAVTSRGAGGLPPLNISSKSCGGAAKPPPSALAGAKCSPASFAGTSKPRSMSASSSARTAPQGAPRSASVPSTPRTVARTVLCSNNNAAAAKHGRGGAAAGGGIGCPGGSKASAGVRIVTNSRVTELALNGAASPTPSPPKVSHPRRSTDSDSGNDSGVNLPESPTPRFGGAPGGVGGGPAAPGSPSASAMLLQLPSPYSKITAPRKARYSSGHFSDNSSVLSGDLPPAMGRSAIFYHSGGSSGYESVLRDSEATGSASSAHDSASEGGGCGASGMASERSRSLKSLKKRAATVTSGSQRGRATGAQLPAASTLAGPSARWVDLRPMQRALHEPFQITVYEIDDLERLEQRRRPDDTEAGLQDPECKLRLLEGRQRVAEELRARHGLLLGELTHAKRLLMLDPLQWNDEFDIEESLESCTLEYLEALEWKTARLQDRLDLCRAKIMMVTCFDVTS